MATRKATVKPQPDTTSVAAPSSLRLYGRNPRKGNVGAVAASLKAHGQYRPVVANIGTHTGRANEVLAGNHTVKAFRQLAEREPNDERWNLILVHWVDVDEDQAKRIVLADNRTSELGVYDNKQLAALLADVSHDLEGLGYSAEDLDAFDAFTTEDTEIDPDALVDDEDEGQHSGGRGQAVIAYSIVFDDIGQKRVWTDFVAWLRRRFPDFTAAQRITAYLHELADENEGYVPQ